MKTFRTNPASFGKFFDQFFLVGMIGHISNFPTVGRWFGKMGGRSKNVLMKRSHGLGDMTMMAKKLHHIFGSNNSAEEKRAIIGLLNIVDDKKLLIERRLINSA